MWRLPNPLNSSQRAAQEALRMAAQQDHQAIFALSLACTHLAEDKSTAITLRHWPIAVLSVSSICAFKVVSCCIEWTCDRAKAKARLHFLTPGFPCVKAEQGELVSSKKRSGGAPCLPGNQETLRRELANACRLHLVGSCASFPGEEALVSWFFRRCS